MAKPADGADALLNDRTAHGALQIHAALLIAGGLFAHYPLRPFMFARFGIRRSRTAANARAAAVGAVRVRKNAASTAAL